MGPTFVELSGQQVRYIAVMELMLILEGIKYTFPNAILSVGHR